MTHSPCIPGHVPAAGTKPSRRRPHPKSTVRRRRALAAAVLSVAVLPLVSGPPATGAVLDEPTMRVIHQLPVLHEPESSSFERSEQGWMVINPHSRRAYQFFEKCCSPALRATWIQSFDLDTLQPLRRVKLSGFLPLAAKFTNAS